jgi:hypothetical protein
VKVAAGVRVKLRQFYLLGRRFHHPNDAPQQKSLNPTYKMEEQCPPSITTKGNKRLGVITSFRKEKKTKGNAKMTCQFTPVSIY